MINSRSSHKRSTLIRFSLSFPAIIVCASAIFVAGLANAAPVLPEQASEAAQRTQSIVTMAKQYRRAVAEEKADLLEQMVALALERQQLLLQLVEDNPGAVLRVALPAKLRAQLPEEARFYVEQRLELEGTLEVLVEDYENGSQRLRHALRTELGEQFSLHFASPPPSLVSGKRVRVGGAVVDPVDDAGPNGAVAVLSGDENVQFLDPDGAPGDDATGTSAAPLDNTFGPQRTVVLLVNFPQRLEEPWSVEDAWNVVFGDASDFFHENSFGQTWLEGDVFGWFTINVDVDSCPTMDIALEAQHAAEAQGIDLSGYERFLYAFPDIGCRWAGQATIGSDPSLAWFDGTLMRAETVTHEVGHNFGLHHSHALECWLEVVGEDFPSLEYGDVLDRMGGSGSGSTLR